jgi:hypothetical protein
MNGLSMLSNVFVFLMAIVLQIKDYTSSFSSFSAASGVDTVFAIKNIRMIPRARIQYTTIARIVDHSKTPHWNSVAGNTLINGATNGLLSPYMKLVNPAQLLASTNLKKRRKTRRVWMIPKMYHTIWTPRYSGFVLGEVADPV